MNVNQQASCLTRCLLTLALSLTVPPMVFSQSSKTNASIFPELAWAETYNREVDLIHSLLNETNGTFDQNAFRSLRTNANSPTIISFHSVSFTFYYPTGLVFAGSSTEMAKPDELLCTSGGISRRAATNEIPANYVRVRDTHRKRVEAELDLLLGIAPLQQPKDIRYSRRSFRFVYEKGWKQD